MAGAVADAVDSVREVPALRRRLWLLCLCLLRIQADVRRALGPPWAARSAIRWGRPSEVKRRSPSRAVGLGDLGHATDPVGGRISWLRQFLSPQYPTRPARSVGAPARLPP